MLRFGELYFCIGCTGMMIGFFFGIIVTLFGIWDTITWEALVILTFLFIVPTMLRAVGFPFFTTSKKKYRLLFRSLSAFGVIIGIVSILKAKSPFIKFGQIIAGISLYLILGYQRLKSQDSLAPCSRCVHEDDPSCPGLSPYFD